MVSTPNGLNGGTKIKTVEKYKVTETNTSTNLHEEQSLLKISVSMAMVFKLLNRWGSKFGFLKILFLVFWVQKYSNTASKVGSAMS